jgi:amino acid transporter
MLVVLALPSFSLSTEECTLTRDVSQIDEVWPHPELLSVVLYSAFFICFGNTAGNSVEFAKHILAASSPQIHQTVEFDRRLVAFIAVAVLTVICLLHYFSSGAGLFLNKILAYYKTGLLFAVFVAGVMARNDPDSGKNDWSKSDSPHSSFSTLSAMIYILYSYQGWENANYVGGEIKVDKPDLQLGGYLAVTATMILYVLATVGYYMACSFDTIVSSNSDLGMGQYFATQALGGHTVGLKVCIALSAAGNLVAVIFTSSKVKQCIARQRIIPFYNFFGDDDRQFGTPRGALMLHWFFTFIPILAMPNTTDGYSFIIGMFTYGHLVVGLFIGWGIWKLRRRLRAFKQLEDWDFKFLTWSWLRNPLVFLWTGVNILIIVVAAIPHTAGTIPRKWWPIILFGVVVPVSFVYWAVLWSMQNGRFGSKMFGVSAKVHHPDATMGRSAGRPQSDFEKMMMAARKDGSNRRTEYDVHGKTWGRLEKGRKYLMEKFYKYLW